MFRLNEDSDGAFDTASLGPRVRFLESAATAFDASTYETTNKAYEILDGYENQNRKLKELGEASVPDINFLASSSDGVDVRDLERVYGGLEPWYSRRGSWDAGMKRIQSYDKRIEELRSKYPDAGLRTTKDLVRDFQQKARDAVRKDDTQRRSLGGSVGGFVGGVAAGLDPRYNLFNFLTAPVGGAGKTVAGRIATEAGAQSAIEAVNEFTGGRTVRQLRGLDTSVAGTVARIGFAGVGGGALQGAGEGVVAASRAVGRRWFNNTPTDPAPNLTDTQVDELLKQSVPEGLTTQQMHTLRQALPSSANPRLAASRVGTARVLDDIDDINTRLQDWGGPSPADIRPRSFIPEKVEGFRLADDLTTRAYTGRATIDELARLADPDTFRVYDGLSAKVDVLRQELDSNPGSDVEWTRWITEANNKVAELTEKVGSKKLTIKQRNALAKERDAATTERDLIMTSPRKSDTPRMSQLRDEIQQADYKMRDLTPLVGRAYARARGDFVESAATDRAVRSMVSSRRPGLSNEETQMILTGAEDMLKAGRYADTVRSTPVVPVIARALPEDLSPGARLVQSALRVVERDAKLAEDNLTVFRDSLDSILKADTDEITVGTHTFRMSDRIEVPNVDGEGSRTMTIRELLDEMNEADYDLKAIQTCSI